MSTAIATHRRPFLPAFNLLLAGGAVVLAVVAIAADDVAAPSTPTAPSAAVAASPNSAVAGDIAVDGACGFQVQPPC